MDGICRNERARIVTKHSIKICNELENARAVAEGIETQEQAQFLRDRRCDMIQGFYYSRPMPKEDYWKRLTETEGEKSKK